MATKRSRVLPVLAILLMAILTCVLLLNVRIKQEAVGSMITADAAMAHEADVILVLGAGITPDGEPSAVLRDRLETAIELYEAGAAPVVLITASGPDGPKDEAAVMQRELTEAGIPDHAQEVDLRGFSTNESMSRAARIHDVKRPIIVTQTFHLPRSLMLAECVGMDAVGVPAEKTEYFEQAWWDGRETLARVKDWILCKMDLI